MATIRDHTELPVYRDAFAAAVAVYEVTKPVMVTDRWMAEQMRRCAASPCANVAEGWEKRRQPRRLAASFIVAQGEAGEIRFWLQFASALNLIEEERARALDGKYREIRAQLLYMSENAARWEPPRKKND